MKRILFLSLMIIGILSSITSAFPIDRNIDYYSSKNDISTTEDVINVNTIENTVSVNPIQAQLSEMCGLELGASLTDVYENNYLVKSQRQIDDDAIVRYDKACTMFYLADTVFQENIRLEFYENRLENVLFKFEGNGENLKDLLIGKWGNPASSITVADRVRYTWQYGDYEARLIIKGNTGNLVFYYTPYARTADRIKRLEYAEYLKTAPEVVNRFENLVRNSPQFKEKFRQELQNDPEYAQALQEAGMDMSIFD